MPWQKNIHFAVQSSSAHKFILTTQWVLRFDDGEISFHMFSVCSYNGCVFAHHRQLTPWRAHTHTHRDTAQNEKCYIKTQFVERNEWMNDEFYRKELCDFVSLYYFFATFGSIFLSELAMDLLSLLSISPNSTAYICISTQTHMCSVFFIVHCSMFIFDPVEIRDTNTIYVAYIKWDIKRRRRKMNSQIESADTLTNEELDRHSGHPQFSQFQMECHIHCQL